MASLVNTHTVNLDDSTDIILRILPSLGTHLVVQATGHGSNLDQFAITIKANIKTIRHILEPQTIDGITFFVAVGIILRVFTRIFLGRQIDAHDNNIHGINLLNLVCGVHRTLRRLTDIGNGVLCRNLAVGAQ